MYLKSLRYAAVRHIPCIKNISYECLFHKTRSNADGGILLQDFYYGAVKSRFGYRQVINLEEARR